MAKSKSRRPRAKKLKPLVQLNTPDENGVATWKTAYTIFTSDGEEISGNIQMRGNPKRVLAGIISKSMLPSGKITAVYMFEPAILAVRQDDGTRELIPAS